MGQTPSSSSRRTPEPFGSRSSSIRASGTFRRQLRIGTFRKKITKPFKSGRSPDYKRHMREMLQSWDLKDVSSLVQEYKAMEALKEVTTQSDLARESVSTLQTDLSSHYDAKYLTDVILEYKGTFFPVHRPILVCRCSFFEKKLSGISDLRKPVCVDVDMDGLTVPLFSFLIKYLYTGEMLQESVVGGEVFRKLGDKFGVPNVLEKDLKTLLESEQLADVTLVVGSGRDCLSSRPSDGSILEFNCHSAILCSRSSYFKSLISRKITEDCTCVGVRKKLRIVIDENILPRQYIRVILQCMYLDCLDLRSTIKWKTTDDVNGNGGETDKLLTTSEMAMELYEIGKFLDFAALCQACEDVIYEEISSSSLVGVLEWSSQPFGSKWVLRQALRYLRDEFVTVSKSTAFIANLPKQFLIKVIDSDFLQACEEDVISAVIRWGEWQVSKAIDKQNGVLSSSLNRRSPKRKDVSDEDLFHAVEDVLPCVRIKQVLPVDSVVLQMAYHRNLFQKPFPLDVAVGDSWNVSSSSWLPPRRSKKDDDYTRPRLFTPYYEEAKAYLKEHMVDDVNTPTLRSYRSIALPDIMPLMDTYENEGKISEHTLERLKTYSADVVAIERRVLKKMERRERELKRMNATQKAFALLSGDNVHLVQAEIQKRIMREFGYPDSFACEVFRHAPDLIEDSSSSSGSSSSRHSTLSKVCFFFSTVTHLSSFV